MKPSAFLQSFARDCRHATRLLGRTPAFTVAAVSTLALAIGANTFVGVAALFLIVACAASFAPALRILRIEPARALRE